MNTQQVNLYQAEFRQRPDPLPPSKMWLVLAVGAVCGVGLLGYNGWTIYAKRTQLAKLERDIAAATSQQTNASQRLATHKGDDSVQKQIQDLEKLLASGSATAALIERQLADGGSGYSSYFTAFAKHHIDQLWLTGITLGPDKTLALSGQAFAPETVLQFLRALSIEPALNGTEFSVFKLEKDPAEATTEANSLVKFRVSTLPEEGEAP